MRSLSALCASASVLHDLEPLTQLLDAAGVSKSTQRKAATESLGRTAASVLKSATPGKGNSWKPGREGLFQSRPGPPRPSPIRSGAVRQAALPRPLARLR
jgi:hypothetical protein